MKQAANTMDTMAHYDDLSSYDQASDFDQPERSDEELFRIKKARRWANWLLAAVFGAFILKQVLWSGASIITKLKSFAFMSDDPKAMAIYLLGAASTWLVVAFLGACIYWAYTISRMDGHMALFVLSVGFVNAGLSAAGHSVPLFGLATLLTTLWMLWRLSRKSRTLLAFV